MRTPLPGAYASCDRKATYAGLADYDAPFHDRFTGGTFLPSLSQRRDFAELTAANELDLALVNPEFRARVGRSPAGTLHRFRPLLSDQAWTVVEEVF
ncbi:hypothetical protein [Actinacidiphila oryziradicis]|uniref:Uncharacterized protein n=1 Tax=Actinacidiphila oryziradicis TaxID=2571141 RepID=A0A4U0T7Y0_9ACTN|nr:hypothetical protein FCI23_20325 [Actinacidiphila oryziradicis]